MVDLMTMNYIKIVINIWTDIFRKKLDMGIHLNIVNLLVNVYIVEKNLKVLNFDI